MSKRSIDENTEYDDNDIIDRINKKIKLSNNRNEDSSDKDNEEIRRDKVNDIVDNDAEDDGIIDNDVENNGIIDNDAEDDGIIDNNAEDDGLIDNEIDYEINDEIDDEVDYAINNDDIDYDMKADIDNNDNDHSIHNNSLKLENDLKFIDEDSFTLEEKNVKIIDKLDELINVDNTLKNNQASLNPSSIKKKSGNSGTIKLIELTNFMNHARLVLNFGPKINVIHGKNGSGKSVFSAALQVALGSSAKETGRGGKLFDLVRRGQQKAVVKVVINNSGIDAYEPEVWGDEIVIIRTITENGAPFEVIGKNKFKVNKNVNVLLVRIMHHFNIQIHNPVVMMTQDVSKQFLQSQDDSDLYKLFIEATKLREMKSHIQDTESQLESWKFIIKKSKTVLSELKSKMTHAEQAYKEAEALEKHEDDLIALKSRLIWATIIAAELNIETIVTEITILKNDVTNLNDKINILNNQSYELDIEYKNVEDKISDFLKEKTKIEAEAFKFELNLKAAKKSKVDIKHNITRQENLIKTFESRLIEAIKRKDEAIKDFEIELENNQSHIELIKFEKQKEEKFNEMSSLRERIKNAMNDDGSNIATLDSEIKVLTENLGEICGCIAMIKDELKRATASLKNSYSTFGASAPEVARDIDDSNWNGDKPIGPLGQYVELIDNKYCVELESILKWSLDAYLVSCFPDLEKLTAILKKYYPSNRLPNIYVEKVFRKFDVIPGRFEYPTALSQFRVTNNWAFNCIINQTGPERIVLFPLRDGENYYEDYIKATRFLKDYGREIKELTTPTTATLKSFNGSIVHTPNHINNNFKSRLIASSVNQTNEFINLNTAKIKSLEKEAYEIQHTLDSATRRRDDLVREAAVAANKLKLLKQSLTYAEKKIHEIESSINVNLKFSGTFDQAPFDKEIFGLQDDIEIASNLVVALNVKVEETDKVLFDLNNNRYNALLLLDNSIFDENTSRLQSICDSIEKVKIKISDFNHEVNRKIDNIKSSQSGLNKLNTKLNSLIAGDLAGERIEEKSSVDDLNSEIRKLDSSICIERNRIGDVDELLLKKISAESEYNKLFLKIKICEGRHADTKSAIKIRDDWWVFFRSKTAQAVHLQFCLNLEKRGHSADLIFDLPNDKLSLKVTMNATANNVSTNNIKMLSGGERSFTTLCFALALGDSISTPFLLMDEFDVFMDSVNRRQAVNLLLENSIKNGGQYILMTPQDISSIKTDHNIRVHVLKDPIRNQDVLNFNNENDNENE